MHNWNLKIHPQYGFSELDSSFDVWGLTTIAYPDYGKVKNENIATKLEQGCVYLVLCLNVQTKKYAVYNGQTRHGFKGRFASHTSSDKFQGYTIQKLFIFTSTSLFRSIDNLVYFEYKFMQFVNHLPLENINKQFGNDNSSFFYEKNPGHDECFSKMKLLLQFLETNFKIYTIIDGLIIEPPIIQPPKLLICENNLFVCKGKRKNGGYFKGKGCLQEGNKFLVLKGSYTDIVNFSFYNAWSKVNLERKKKMLNNGILIKDNNSYVFQKDHLFASPSGAAGFLCANSVNWMNCMKMLQNWRYIRSNLSRQLDTLSKNNWWVNLLI